MQIQDRRPEVQVQRLPREWNYSLKREYNYCQFNSQTSIEPHYCVGHNSVQVHSTAECDRVDIPRRTEAVEGCPPCVWWGQCLAWLENRRLLSFVAQSEFQSKDTVDPHQNRCGLGSNCSPREFLPQLNLSHFYSKYIQNVFGFWSASKTFRYLPHLSLCLGTLKSPRLRYWIGAFMDKTWL